MVYFLKGEKTGLIKIGVSHSRTFDDRLKWCQVGSPDILQCVGYRLDWSYAEETILHRKFKHLRSHGEWYKLDYGFTEFLVNLENEVIEKYEYLVTVYNKVCSYCSKEFTTHYENQLYCSHVCRDKKHNKKKLEHLT